MIGSKHGAPMRQEPSVSVQVGPQKKAVILATCTSVAFVMLAIMLPIITCLIVRENNKVFDAWWYQYGGGLGLSVMLALTAVVMGKIAVKNKSGKTKDAARLALHTCFFSMTVILTISLIKIALLFYGAEADDWLYRYGCAAGMTFLMCIIIIISSTIVAYDMTAAKAGRASSGDGDIKPSEPDADNE